MPGDISPKPNFGVGDRKPGPIARRVERVKRVADFISTVGRRDGVSAIRDLMKDHSEGVIRSFNAADLCQPFLMPAAYSDLAMFTEIIGRRLYELPPEMDALVNGRPIVDIGANIGVSAAYFASRYPGSKVIAIEPHHRNYELLTYNAGLYDGQIEPWAHALDTKEGYVDLSNGHVGNIGHHAVYQFDVPVSEMGPNTAPAITPAEVAEKAAPLGKIGLLKMNIEGAENKILADPASDVLLQLSNVAIIEAHDREREGTSEVVLAAAKRAGLVQFDKRGSFNFFINSSRQN